MKFGQNPMNCLVFLLSIMAVSGFGILKTNELALELIKGDSAVPIVMLHGYGSYCGKYEWLEEYLSDNLGIHAEWVEPAIDKSYWPSAKYSIQTPIKEQGAKVCELLNDNPNFQGEFDLFGFSQGTIVSRYVIQYCNLNGKVRNFVSFGGPLNGQSSNPWDKWELLCRLNSWWENKDAFTEKSQQSKAVAGYWRDPNNYQEYLSHSSFIAEANNEVNYSEDRRQRFLNLNRVMFIIFAQETTISPPESSWWGEYNINGTALVRQQTQVYQKDLIGIKSLESQGRATFATLPGKHVQITEDDIRNVVIPFILGR